MVDKPSAVSQEVWDEVIPARTERVVLLAGRIMLRGSLSPDEAIRAAVIKDEWDTLMKEPGARRIMHALSVPFRETFGDAQPRSPQLTAAIRALLHIITEEKHNLEKGTDAVRIAIRNKAWSFTPGICTVCGEDIQGDAARSPLPLHIGCMNDMTLIGSVFRKTAESFVREFREEQSR